MTTAPKPFVFVLMPFSKEFDDTYELAIQPACEAAGAYAERVDKQIFTGSILDRVYNQISKADLIVADMSERNPNVFYEVGYAHALGKTTVLVTKSAEDIPFDLKHYSHIIYNNRLSDLKNSLETRLRWHLNNPEKNSIEEDSLLVRVNGFSLEGQPTILVPVPKARAGFELKIEIKNKITRSISVANFQVGFLVPNEFISARASGLGQNIQIAINDEQILFLNDYPFSVLPEAWCSISFLTCTDNRVIVGGELHNFCVRIYRDSGMHDFPFKVLTEISA